jgi:deoxyribonuclease-4
MYGAHIGFGGTVREAIEEGSKLRMHAIQIFMGNPKSFSRSRITERDILASREACVEKRMNLFTHFPYVANLAGSKDILAWSGNAEQDAKTNKVLTSLEYELGVVARASGSSSTPALKNGVVIHPGNHTEKEDGLRAIGESINRITFAPNSTLILENSAGGGTALATTFDEIATIIAHVAPEKRGHVKVCLDTAHIFGYGEYDLRKSTEVDRMFEEFDAKIGIGYFHLLHLNDSEVPLKSRKDRHACLCTGFIWKENDEALWYLLGKCASLSVPVILETHVSDMAHFVQ